MQRIGQRRLIVLVVVGRGESPVKAVSTRRLLDTWRRVVVREDNVVDDGVDAVVEKVDPPSHVCHDIVHALVSRVTGSFHRIPGNIARAGDTIANTHVYRIGRVPKMPDVFQVLGEPWGLREMESTGR